jgi:hypothetical protein
MESKKDIGKAFREKLDTLQKQPGDAVWDSIRGDLGKSKPKGMPAWIKLMTMGSLLLLIGFFTYPLWENHVPHIYMEMPNENGGQESDDIQNGPNAGSPSTSGINENTSGTQTGVVENASGETGPATNSESGTNATETIRNANSNSATAANNTNTHNNVNTTSSGARISNSNNQAYSSESVAGNSRQASAAGRTRSSSTRVTTTGTTAKTGTAQSKTNTSSVKGATQKSTSANTTVADNTTTVKNSRIPTLKGDGSKFPEKTATEDGSQDLNKSVNTQTDPRYRSYRNNARVAINDDTAKDSVAAKEKKKAINDSISANTDLGEKGADAEGGGSDLKRFSLFAFAAPAGYGIPENGEYLDAALSANGASSKGLAFGGFIGYNLDEDLSVRLGVITHKTENDINEIRLTTSEDGSAPARDFTGVEFEGGANNDMIRQQLGQGVDENADIFAVVNLHHQFDFVEIPLEVNYRLYGNKFSVGLNGGFAARIVTTNSIYAYNEVGKITLGKMRDIEDTNFSAGLGVRLAYEFFPNFQINLEPTARYYFKDDGFLQPFTYSVQAGLQYNFDLFKSK